MSQPPQPPNQPPGPPPQPPQPPGQPPQDAFGAPPQGPPPGTPPPPSGGPSLDKPAEPGPGYGYPQQPPAGQPGPPPPGQPPAQSPGAPTVVAGPGYGYPQSAPQPGPPAPPPGGHQPYGQPAPATVPMPASGGGGGLGKTAKTQLAIIVSAVLACALIIGGGVWYSHSDSGSKPQATGKDGKDGKTEGGGTTGGGGGKEKPPADPSSQVLFQLPMPAVKGDSSITIDGSWLTDKVYAKSGVAEIGGYDPQTGKKIWTIKLPGPVCAATNHLTEDHRTAIAFQPKMPTKDDPYLGCSQVAGVDLDTGKLLWTKSTKTQDRTTNFDEVTIGGGTVAAGGSLGGAGWDLATGKVLWPPKVTECYDQGYAGGGKGLIAIRKCGQSEDSQLTVQNIDPKSGKILSQYKMPAGIDFAHVVSTDPLVVAAKVGDTTKDGSGISDYFSIDVKTGKLRTKITAEGDKYGGKCDAVNVEGCRMIAVGADKLFLPTEQHEGTGDSVGQTNEIVSFDLGTGKPTGQRSDAGNGYQITPLRMDGGNLIAYKKPPYDKGGQIVSINGDTYKETKLLENPADNSVRSVETDFQPEFAEILYSEGHLYMSAVFARKPYTPGDRQYLAIGFGTK
ncbi:PQQ-binding-like beta-propeller repeat protein [Streptomyces sp. NPDC058045]|uniref:outer membrane protein assembly factor BamB family protein n=1 Tax=Streptomyces sp. NPDC058045 TaxID=3346311 RepID=UPI0036E01993